MTTSQSFDVYQILNILHRRKDIIIAVAVVAIILAIYLAQSLPNVYRSSTLILVTPQSLPPKYVDTTVTSTIQGRMRSIAEQVLGRTTLATVVKEFDLFSSGDSDGTIEERVGMLRKGITLQINRNDTFVLSYDAENPEDARRVTARLASLFIEENLKVREQQAAGTTSFINAEAERLRRELEEQEDRVNKFNAQYWHELPGNRDVNSRALDQLRRELENNLIRLVTLQDRRVALENQIAEREGLEKELGMLGRIESGSIYDPKQQLEKLLTKYSERHPDVIRLRREIETLQNEIPVEKSKNAVSNRTVPIKSPLMTALVNQLRDIKIEIESLQTRNHNLRSNITAVQSRLDNTPFRAIELAKITRTYDITLKKYQDLLAKSLESELSENMERKQKGEQFQIVDEPNLPQTPFAPNRTRILLIGLFLGIGGGIGAAFLLETLDKSFKSNEDLAGYTNIPLLAVLPAVATRGNAVELKQARMMVVLVSCGTLALGVALVRLFGTMIPIRWIS